MTTTQPSAKAMEIAERLRHDASCPVDATPEQMVEHEARIIDEGNRELVEACMAAVSKLNPRPSEPWETLEQAWRAEAIDLIQGAIAPHLPKK